MTEKNTLRWKELDLFDNSAMNSKLTAESSQCPWKGTPRTLRPSMQTLAAVLLLIGRSLRLNKTETPQKKPPKVHGLGPNQLP